MNGIVLGAGRGSRLTPFTDDRPKCLIELNGVTLLERQVGALKEIGANPIKVVVGWKSEQVRKRGFTTIENPQWYETSMTSSLRCARDLLLNNVTLVSYGDIIYSKKIIAHLAHYEQPLVIAYDPNWLTLWTRRFANPLLDAETFCITSEGLLIDIGGRPSSLDAIQGQYMGLLRFTPEAWREAERILDELPARHTQLDMTALLQRVIQAGRIPVHAIPTIGPWCEIDHPLDITIASEIAQALDD